MNHIGHGVTMLLTYQIALIEALKTASSDVAECHLAIAKMSFVVCSMLTTKPKLIELGKSLINYAQFCLFKI